MSDFDFTVFNPFIADPLITDINYNGQHLWVDHLKKGRYCVEAFDYHQECMQVGYRFSNYANLPFNSISPVVESETNDLRISLIHPSISGQLSISIRKTPAIMRLKVDELKKQGYAPDWLLKLLAQLVAAKSNILISGLPGAGKTELVKYLSQFIESNQRIITIEDTYELRIKDLHPNVDCVAMKVNDRFDYNQAIKASLRQRPDWILVSEVRGAEVVNLLQSVSTGATLLSTIHSPSAPYIPRRLLHMMPGLEISNETIYHMICDVIDIGIHVEAMVSKKGVKRYIKEVCAYSIENNKPKITTLYKANEQESEDYVLPIKIMEKQKHYFRSKDSR